MCARLFLRALMQGLRGGTVLWNRSGTVLELCCAAVGSRARHPLITAHALQLQLRRQMLLACLLQLQVCM